MILWGLVAVTDSVQHTSQIATSVCYLLVSTPCVIPSVWVTSESFLANNPAEVVWWHFRDQVIKRLFYTLCALSLPLSLGSLAVGVARCHETHASGQETKVLSPITTCMSLELEPPVLVKPMRPHAWTTAWLQPHERTRTRSPQLGHIQISDP